jgi:hypothetical protein
MPAALRLMTAAGWAHADLGTFSATVRIGGVNDATFLTLLQAANFPRGSRRMHLANWTPTENGNFVVGALQTTLPEAHLAALVDHAGFGVASRLLLGPGWTPNEVGRIAGQARRQNFQPAALTAFLNTANVPATTFQLRGRAGWDADEVGQTVGHCRTRAGSPTDQQMERLLFLAQTPAGVGGAQVQPLWIRNAADGNVCGPPAWAQMIAHTPTFQANWVGPRNHADEAPATWAGVRGGVYQVQLRLYGERIRHAEVGHTFEYFDLSYANCTRLGVGVAGHCTFFALGRDVTALMQGYVGNGALNAIAENAAWNAGPTQRDHGGCRWGVLRDGPAFGPAGNPTYPTWISQCYPLAGTQIVGRDLVAIGRFMGRIIP